MGLTARNAGAVCGMPLLAAAPAGRVLNSTYEDLRVGLALLAPAPLPLLAAPSRCEAVVRVVQLCLGFWLPTLVLAWLECGARAAYCRQLGQQRRQEQDQALWEQWHAVEGNRNGAGSSRPLHSQELNDSGSRNVEWQEGRSMPAERVDHRILCCWRGWPSALAVALAVVAFCQAALVG